MRMGVRVHRPRLKRSKRRKIGIIIKPITSRSRTNLTGPR